MATIGELLKRTQSLIDDTLTNSDMIDWFNQCQENLADVLYLPTRKTITRDVVSGNFLMPDDVNGELVILEPTVGKYYTIYDNYILFDGSDDTETTSITVSYNKFPKVLTNNPDSVPEIPKRFHSVFPLYASMMAMHADEEPTRYDKYEKDYMRLRYEIQKYCGKMRPKPDCWKVIR